jgi:hypothetical protein
MDIYTKNRLCGIIIDMKALLIVILSVGAIEVSALGFISNFNHNPLAVSTTECIASTIEGMMCRAAGETTSQAVDFHLNAIRKMSTAESPKMATLILGAMILAGALLKLGHRKVVLLFSSQSMHLARRLTRDRLRLPCPKYLREWLALHELSPAR